MPQTIFILSEEDYNDLISEVRNLKKEVSRLKELQDQWVDTAKACKLTGIKSRTTLQTERERKETKLRFKYEGTKVLYSLQSIYEYNDNKSRRIIPYPELKQTA